MCIRDSLGTPENGPYLAYLLPLAADPSVTGVGPAWPSIPPEAWLVGEVAITPGPIEQAPGFFVGPNGATIRFPIPGHLPPEVTGRLGAAIAAVRSELPPGALDDVIAPLARAAGAETDPDRRQALAAAAAALH